MGIIGVVLRRTMVINFITQSSDPPNLGSKVVWGLGIRILELKGVLMFYIYRIPDTDPIRTFQGALHHS